jgi:hypothetical protein
MKRLFKVGEEFFESKREAKKRRDAIGKDAKVSRGPDHWRGESGAPKKNVWR